MNNHYKTLGIEEGASQAEIKAAYNSLSKELNPANNDNQDFFKEEYKKVQLAYKALYNTSILATKQGAENDSILGLKTAKETSAKPSKNKGNSVYTNQQQKEVNQTFKTHNILNYVITRKRNILIFILLTLVLKPILHYTFFEEISKVVSTEKIELGDEKYYDDFNLKDSIGNLTRLNARGYVQLHNRYLFYYEKKLTVNAKNYRKYGLFNKKGEPIYLVDNKYITYKPKKIEFNEYFKEKYTDKFFIFLISFAIIGLIAFLFNNEIKVR